MPPASPTAAPIKVLLHDNGDSVETVWAFPLERRGERVVVRLDNLPFLHAKPTYGDVIVVGPDPAHPDFLSWNAAGRDYAGLVDALEEDGGRYALIFDYTCPDRDKFAQLSAWAKATADLELEGARGPEGGRPGRVYVAAVNAARPARVHAALAKNPFEFRFELVHPKGGGRG